MKQNKKPLLKVSDFSVDFTDESKGKKIRAVDNISLEVMGGEFAALVGESGCGKSLTALGISGLLPDSASASGLIEFSGQKMAIIFQDAAAALDPLMTCGRQIAEAARVHGEDKASSEKSARDFMKRAGISEGDIKRIYSSYPHELSGGQKQRVLIAMTLINRPDLLIADEPTSALDADVQKEILDTITALNSELKTSMLLITHDLSIVRRHCARLYVMYAGRIVESGGTADVLENPLHPYTRALLDAIPGNSKSRLKTVPGSVPPPQARRENACHFFERCPLAKELCARKKPESFFEGSHFAACNFCGRGNQIQGGQDKGIQSQDGKDRNGQGGDEK